MKQRLAAGAALLALLAGCCAMDKDYNVYREWDSDHPQFHIFDSAFNTPNLVFYTFSEGTNVLDPTGKTWTLRIAKDDQTDPMLTVSGTPYSNRVEFQVQTNVFYRSMRSWYCPVVAASNTMTWTFARGQLTLQPAPEINAAEKALATMALYGPDYGPFTGSFSNWPFVTTSELGVGVMMITNYDTNLNYAADDADQLGGQLPSYYAISASQHLAGILSNGNDAAEIAMTNVGWIGLDVDASAPAHDEGRLFYDEDEHAVAFYNDESDVTVQWGETLVRVRNTSGQTITNGLAVYQVGTQGHHPLVDLASATNAVMAVVVGVATHDIENNGWGYVTAYGGLHGIDTSMYASNDVMYLSATLAGALTNVAPGNGYYNVRVGNIRNAHATQGILFVAPRQAMAHGEVQGLAAAIDADVAEHAAVNDTQAWIVAQYPLALLTNGTRAMGADLNMGTQVLDQVDAITFGGSSFANMMAPGIDAGANTLWIHASNAVYISDGAGYGGDFRVDYGDTYLKRLYMERDISLGGNTVSNGSFIGNGSGLTNLTPGNVIGLDHGAHLAGLNDDDHPHYVTHIEGTNAFQGTNAALTTLASGHGGALTNLSIPIAEVLSNGVNVAGMSPTNATSYGLSNGTSFGISEYNKITNAWDWGNHADAGYLTGLSDNFWQITVANTSSTHLATSVVSNGTFTSSGAGWATTNGTWLLDLMACPFGATTTLTQSNRMAVLTGRVYKVSAYLNVSASGSAEGVLIALGGETNTWTSGDDRTIHAEYLITPGIDEGLRIEITPTNDAVYLDNVTVQRVTEGDVRAADDVYADVLWLQGTNVLDLASGDVTGATNKTGSISPIVNGTGPVPGIGPTTNELTNALLAVWANLDTDSTDDGGVFTNRNMGVMTNWQSAAMDGDLDGAGNSITDLVGVVFQDDDGIEFPAGGGSAVTFDATDSSVDIDAPVEFEAGATVAAGQALNLDEGALQDSRIVSADIKDGVVASNDLNWATMPTGLQDGDDTGTDDQTLAEVLTQGSLANGDIDMQTNNLDLVDEVIFAGSAGTNMHMAHLYHTDGTNYMALWMVGASVTNLYPVKTE